ncbi:MAG: di-heme oxidoredictase family protein [Moheibacter sp.]
MKRFLLLILLSIFFLANISCNNDDGEIGKPIDMSREYAGGETTIFSMSNIAYSSPAPNLQGTDLERHLLGDTDFDRVFVTAPAPLNPGLGPVYNNSSCIKCHPSDGRAKFPIQINSFSGLLFRISIPGASEHLGPNPVPGLGGQAQNHAIYNYQPEMEYNVDWKEVTETLADGTVVSLRKPNYYMTNSSVPLPSNMMISPRIAPPVFGLGLLEFIDELDILALSDESDNDMDGISGKPNYVWNPITQQTELGRFGWKANTPTLQLQIASAYHEDMGITSFAFLFDEYSDGLEDDPELSTTILNQAVFYCQTLAVPAARNVGDKQVNRGYEVFQQLNCNSCHVPKQKTGNTPIRVLSNQEFYPFTDLLLHDMGEELADNRPDYKADGQEWKTRPLWGIGLQQIVNGHTEFLHDGRARNLTEAIMWHGGEAEESKEGFKNLSTQDRLDILKFLNSL